MGCMCDEGFIEDIRTKERARIFPEGSQKHDCSYIAARNKLIPEAIEMADAVKHDPTDEWAWTRAFVKNMNKLAKKIVERDY